MAAHWLDLYSSGYSPCGTGGCPQGTKCDASGLRCVGRPADGPKCPSGINCFRGQGCGPSGGCYDLTYEYLCGNHTCIVGKDYPASDVCAPCKATAPHAALPNQQDDLAICASPSTIDTADRNIAACTRVINNSRYTRQNIAVAYSSRCADWITKKDFDRALADCDQAIIVDPNQARAFAIRGSVYKHMGALERAIADFKKALTMGDEEARKSLRSLGVVP